MKQQLSIQGFFSQFVTSTLKGEKENKVKKKIPIPRNAINFFSITWKKQRIYF
jgi:hypothetical protein